MYISNGVIDISKQFPRKFHFGPGKIFNRDRGWGEWVGELFLPKQNVNVSR